MQKRNNCCFVYLGKLNAWLEFLKTWLATMLLRLAWPPTLPFVWRDIICNAFVKLLKMKNNLSIYEILFRFCTIFLKETMILLLTKYF